jgi:formylglycine-generating enzyme required for sulfatase activity
VTRLALLLIMCAGVAAAEELPAGLRPGGVADVRSASVQLYLWKLPGDAGDLDLVRVDDALFVARTEVTRRAFLAFCEAKGVKTPPAAPGADGQHPVADVTFDEAQAFCAWAGLALPTEAEWARAAGSGPFPWGADTGEVRSNSCDASCPEAWEWKETDVTDGHAYTAPVGSWPANAAPCGALDLAGNVWEWCATWADEAQEARLACGGGWCSPRSTGRITSRNAFEPEARWAGLGFRPVLRP